MKTSRDLLAGLLFSGIGTAALIIAQTYSFGSTLSMGPGYFPTIIASLILLFGIVITVRELWASNGPQLGSIGLRPLVLITAAIVGFGLLIEPAGLIASVAFLVIVGWLANPQRTWRELPFLLAGGIIVPILIFRVGLNMPIKLWVL